MNGSVLIDLFIFQVSLPKYHFAELPRRTDSLSTRTRFHVCLLCSLPAAADLFAWILLFGRHVAPDGQWLVLCGRVVSRGFVFRCGRRSVSGALLLRGRRRSAALPAGLVLPAQLDRVHAVHAGLVLSGQWSRRAQRPVHGRLLVPDRLDSAHASVVRCRLVLPVGLVFGHGRGRVRRRLLLPHELGRGHAGAVLGRLLLPRGLGAQHGHWPVSGACGYWVCAGVRLLCGIKCTRRENCCLGLNTLPCFHFQMCF